MTDNERMAFRGTIEAVCMAEARGPKRPVQELVLVRGVGVLGDVHAGAVIRQVSLLEAARIRDAKARGLRVTDGAFGENIITDGVDFSVIRIGTRFRIGADAVLQLTQKGKFCPEPCGIYRQVGDCIMSGQGLFARVVRGGVVRSGDALRSDPSLDGVRFAVITLSDRATRGEYQDESGPLAVNMLEEYFRVERMRAVCVGSDVLPDGRERLEAKLISLCDQDVCDVIVTTGGTGLSPRDLTPEATRAVIDREIPGMAEAMRAAGLAKTPHAMLSRAVCGMRGTSLVINLSGSPKAVREQLAVVLPALKHAIGIASGLVSG